MQISYARMTLVGITAMMQSHQHSDPKLKGEGNDKYDQRTWRSKLNVEKRGERNTVVIPAAGIHKCLVEAARYSKRQIPGQNKAQWHPKFASGIMVMGSAPLNIDPASLSSVLISADAQGIRNSGKRVPRRFPVIPPGWRASVEIGILDPIIPEDVFLDMVEIAGIFIGLGSFRPQNGGDKGRFVMEEMQWEDNRELMPTIEFMNNQGVG